MTPILDRRLFINGAGVAAAAVALEAAQADSPPALTPKPAILTAKPLRLDPKSVPGLSEKLLVSHYENNYLGAVKRLNAIDARLAELDFAKAPNFVLNGLKREELLAMNSALLHEVYFDSLAGAGAPKGALLEAITRDFGGLDRWSAEFSALGKAEGGGSGWVILSFSPQLKRLVTQ
jgi:Fe-Mn family superoxide dismutase